MRLLSTERSWAFVKSQLAGVAMLAVACGVAEPGIEPQTTATPGGYVGTDTPVSDEGSTKGEPENPVVPESASSARGKGGMGGATSTVGGDVAASNASTTGGASTGGTGGDDGGAATQTCRDPRCERAELGASCMGHLLNICEDVDGDGCVEFLQRNCAPGVCAGTASECSSPEGATGETCEDAIVVSHSGFVLSGPDLSGEFDNDLELREHADCQFSDAGAADAVFAVTLGPGEVLNVTQQGELQAVIALKSSCEATQPCIDSQQGGRGLALSHRAVKSETVYVVVDAYQAKPQVADYQIRIDIDAACGNGVLEAAEDCDDSNTMDGDGCSATCMEEFGFRCEPTSPSLCELLPSLGEAGADGHIEPLEVTSLVPEGDRRFYTVTFTERVLVDVLARTRTPPTGDINVIISDSDGVVLVPGIRSGDDEWLGEAFEPGQYLVELRASTQLPQGFELLLTLHSPGTCGDEVFVPAFEDCDNGGKPGCKDCKVEFGWHCDQGADCTEIPSLGSGAYVVGDSIDPVVSTEPVAGYSSRYWIIEFAEDVLLNGTIDANGEAYAYVAYVALSDENATIVHSAYLDDGVFQDWLVPAGRYQIEFLTYGGLPAGYTMMLEISAP